ncbi:MAG: DNA replication complex subunit Gins51 [Candidatus Ranarchaeia archaeon]
MYQKIYKIWEKENGNLENVKVPASFWEDVREYIKQLKLIIENSEKKDLQSSISHKELQNTKFMLKEINRLRRKKIVKSVSERVIDEKNLSEIEVQILKNSSEEFQKFDLFLDDLLKGIEFVYIEEEKSIEKSASKANEKSEKPQYLFVRFKTDLQSVIGVDSKIYGPFKAEDMVTLPFENAKSLIERDVVQEVNYKS